MSDQFVSVATVKQISVGWKVEPPSSSAIGFRIFDQRSAAIQWAVSKGWGVHLTK